MPDWKPGSISNHAYIAAYLKANNAYFNKLRQADRLRFVQRVIYFIRNKSFDGREGFVVTPDMEIDIAASAVQLTLGLDTWDLSYFNHILVYRSDYKSPATGKYHKGETNMGGFICFSWPAFAEGYRNPHDKVNLGLHEFAHALRFNGIRGNVTDYFFENYFARWLGCANREFRKLRDHSAESIFRKYGGVNINEFFSVAIETFFETPMAFKATLPELYTETSILLNQTFTETGAVQLDCRPELMKTNNFRLSKAYPEVMRFNLRNLGRSIVSLVFALAGAALLLNDGYHYPAPYILLSFSVLAWLYLEWNYTKVYFERDHFSVRKGFWLPQGWRAKRLPYSALISFKLAYEYHYDEDGTRGDKYADRASIAYYTKGSFYKDRLHIVPVQPAFDELCRELRHHSVFVAITS